MSEETDHSRRSFLGTAAASIVVAATDGRSSASKFSGTRSHRLVRGAGHNLPEEAPGELAGAVWELASAKL